MTDVSQAQRDWTAIIGAKLYPASVKLSDALYESADWSTVPPAYRPLPVEVEDLGAPIANALAWSLTSDELKGIRDKPAEDPRDEADAVATIVLPRITMPASGTTAYAAWGTAARPMTKPLWVKLREYLDANPPDLA